MIIFFIYFNKVWKSSYLITSPICLKNVLSNERIWCPTHFVIKIINCKVKFCKIKPMLTKAAHSPYLLHWPWLQCLSNASLPSTFYRPWPLKKWLVLLTSVQRSLFCYVFCLIRVIYEELVNAEPQSKFVSEFMWISRHNTFFSVDIFLGGAGN